MHRIVTSRIKIEHGQNVELVNAAKKSSDG